MHGEEEDAGADVGGDDGADADFAAGVVRGDDVAVGDVAGGGVVGVDFAEGRVDVGGEAVDLAGFGHGVPLVADAAGGEDEGMVGGEGFGAVLKVRGWRRARRVGVGNWWSV